MKKICKNNFLDLRDLEYFMHVYFAVFNVLPNNSVSGFKGQNIFFLKVRDE